ncbi:metallophosphoesterase [Candidatus Zixiibacteriota bacterium]
MAEMTFLTLGDIHGSVKWTRELISAAETVDTVLLCGDLTSFGTPEDVAGIIEDIARYNTTCYAIAGNCDSLAIDSFLTDQDIALNGRGRMIGDSIGVCGVSGSNSTPFRTPLEYTEEELSESLQAGWQQILDASIRIVVHHAPPYRTKCDRTLLGIHTGVRMFRAFCENEQPELVICGHIHEARGTDMIGETLVVNGGMAARGHGTVIEVSNGDLTVSLL